MFGMMSNRRFHPPRFLLLSIDCFIFVLYFVFLFLFCISLFFLCICFLLLFGQFAAKFRGGKCFYLILYWPPSSLFTFVFIYYLFPNRPQNSVLCHWAVSVGLHSSSHPSIFTHPCSLSGELSVTTHFSAVCVCVSVTLSLTLPLQQRSRNTVVNSSGKTTHYCPHQLFTQDTETDMEMSVSGEKYSLRDRHSLSSFPSMCLFLFSFTSGFFFFFFLSSSPSISFSP